jgi:hypothetical protein
MKNVHLLPTDKPSRLVIDTIENKLYLQGILHEKTINVLPQNIYITNDEEIKIDDYYLGEDNNLYCLVSKVNSNGKKIILTTDHELIDEGIQPIDDEFLEWFVKNPSCEKVYTTDEYVQVNQDNPILRGSTNVSHRYEIIIPQEEVFEMYSHLYGKTVTMDDRFETKHIWSEELALKNKGRWIPQEESKQETLEEAAEKYAEDWNGTIPADTTKLDFIAGAKWMEKQMENLKDFDIWKEWKNRT